MRDSQGTIKIYLTAPPLEGMANKALIQYLAKFFKLPKTAISILSGLTSREKKLQIEYSEEYIIHKLNELG